MEKINLFILLMFSLTQPPIYFFLLESLMLDQGAFKSHSVRKRTPVFYNLASLESTDKHKGHLADHLFLCFTN